MVLVVGKSKPFFVEPMSVSFAVETVFPPGASGRPVPSAFLPSSSASPLVTSLFDH